MERANTEDMPSSELRSDPIRAGAPDGMTPDDVEQRSRLGRYIPQAALPGDRDELLRGAQMMHAPEDVLAQLARLPRGQRFETVSQAWAALGHPNESHRS